LSWPLADRSQPIRPASHRLLDIDIIDILILLLNYTLAYITIIDIDVIIIFDASFRHYAIIDRLSLSLPILILPLL
jgi:hypothetical protein